MILGWVFATEYELGIRYYPGVQMVTDCHCKAIEIPSIEMCCSGSVPYIIKVIYDFDIWVLARHTFGLCVDVI